MNYLVAVLPDRSQAEAAYSALQQEGLPNDGINILGDGYQSADDYGLIDPNLAASKEIKREFYWLVGFGFIAGFAFNWLTAIEILPAIAPIGNHIIGGIFGAAAGAMGAYFSGGAVGLTIGSGDALPYRNRLNAGKYLVIVQGTNELVDRANRILRQFEPENIQGYTEPIGT
ncbi:hypothetical protein [Chamaesiphon sp.]|uniref:hypothetical protein n=1 Tax=Chamaesiphon sp. TaxID=2814140 RepID=UPI0035942FA0